ncbi:MAG TPA: exodeoxyribonuclease I [Xanthomonadaceae bacterium]|nr:exodeoxyribonuclease I [Xanthomonadaceae bacterium]
MPPSSFFWYDLETFGRDPRRTRIAQFAGRRTDAGLEPVGEPLVLYARPADDLLPAPEAVLLTGITPQHCLRHGVSEAELLAHIHEAMTEPGTCAAGFNSLRFDDEFLRFGFYRNFFDPYEREWRNGNSRWDLLDLARLTHALRPEGIHWPLRKDGAPSFRLADLCAANGIDCGRAHDALVDVDSTIALARLVRAVQPRLFDYYLGLRDKRAAAALLDVAGSDPVVHISGRFAATRRCAAAILPLAVHPLISNRMICFDLESDPSELLAADAEAIAERLYVPGADLPEGMQRFALKDVHLNRVPALVAWRHLRNEDFERMQIDAERVLAHAAALRASGTVAAAVRDAYAIARPAAAAADADQALYEGFPDERDRARFPTIRSAPATELRRYEAQLKDPRYRELLFRYRARNHPDSLDAGERGRWDAYRRLRLGGDADLSEYSFETYRREIDRLRRDDPAPGPRQALLDALEDWGCRLEADL